MRLVKFRVTLPPFTDLVLPNFFSRSSWSDFTRSSKRRLTVGYLERDLVIPHNLAQQHKVSPNRKAAQKHLHYFRQKTDTSEPMHVSQPVFVAPKAAIDH